MKLKKISTSGTGLCPKQPQIPKLHSESARIQDSLTWRKNRWYTKLKFVNTNIQVDNVAKLSINTP